MQTLNKKLEEQKLPFEEYFKPIDKEAEIIVKMELDGEGKSMRDMMDVMQRQALLEKAEVEKLAMKIPWTQHLSPPKKVHRLDDSKKCC